MCVIVYQPKGKEFPKQLFRNCWEQNHDGAGFMYASNGEITIQKGYFKLKNFWKAYQKALQENKDSDFVLHFRIATHGLIDKQNCHPHRVNDKLAIAHNGVLRNVPDDKKKSDTIMFCETILEKLPDNFLENEAIFSLLDDFIGTSKIVYLDNSGKVTIMNEKAGDWHKGLWFSNDSYRDDRKYIQYYVHYATPERKVGKVRHYGSYGNYGRTIWEDATQEETLEIKINDKRGIFDYCEYCGMLLSSAIEYEVGLCWDCIDQTNQANKDVPPMPGKKD